MFTSRGSLSHVRQKRTPKHWISTSTWSTKCRSDRLRVRIMSVEGVISKETDSVRYVLSGAPTGWAAMAKTVREVDEEKVKDYKEDIDTLLVFAGLFSAVMTAFIIESYHSLQEDPATASLQVLREISAQTSSYSFNGTLLVSTISSAASCGSSPPFKPDITAIRINVLWFASLTFSLITASLAMLVKQWLREYLSGEYTSGLARLRVRHYRLPGLQKWKVFEIAAALPLLLQLSLGLFLIGLCFFTSSVHPSLGKSNIPLVVGWAFVVLSATAAPAFSPHCPYKVAFLKSAMKKSRRSLYPVLRFSQHRIYRLIRFAMQSVRMSLVVALQFLKKSVHQTGRWIAVVLQQVRRFLHAATQAMSESEYLSTESLGFPRFISAGIPSLFSPLIHSLTRLISNVIKYLPVTNVIVRSIMMDYPRASIYRLVGHIILLRQSARKVMETYISVEEDEAAKQLEFDLDILAAVDAIQADDDLLATTIYESVRQTQLDLDPEAILDFAFQILGNHSQRSADDLRSSLPLDLSSVTKRTWMAIADIVAEAISYDISIQLARDRSVSWKDWMSDALLLLVSPGPSSHLFTDHGRKFIKTCITYAPSETSHTLISRYSTPHSAAPTGGWEVVVRILLANGILQQCSNADIFSFSKSTAMNLKATSLLDMTTRALTLELSENHIWTLVMVAAEALHRQLDDVLAASTPWETWMDEALLFICKATGNKYWLQTDLIRGIHGKLLVGLSAPHFLRFLANPSNAEILENDTMRLLPTATDEDYPWFKSPERTPDTWSALLEDFIQVSTHASSDENMLLLCRPAILLIHQFEREVATQNGQRLFPQMTSIIKAQLNLPGYVLGREREVRRQKLAMQCLASIDDYEQWSHEFFMWKHFTKLVDSTKLSAYDEWKRFFDPRKSPFNDDLISVLNDIAPRTDTFRVRLLKEKRTALEASRRSLRARQQSQFNGRRERSSGSISLGGALVIGRWMGRYKRRRVKMPRIDEESDDSDVARDGEALSSGSSFQTNTTERSERTLDRDDSLAISPDREHSAIPLDRGNMHFLDPYHAQASGPSPSTSSHLNAGEPNQEEHEGSPGSDPGLTIGSGYENEGAYLGYQHNSYGSEDQEDPEGPVIPIFTGSSWGGDAQHYVLDHVSDYDVGVQHQESEVQTEPIATNDTSIGDGVSEDFEAENGALLTTPTRRVTI